MELRRYLYPLRKWWWLLVTATLVAGLSSFLATLRQPPVYQTRTTLMIGRTIEDPNPTNNQFYLSQQLAITYADIANRDLVRNATMEALRLRSLPEYQAAALPNTQLIEIIVTDVNPQRAQAVANELANQLIAQSPSSSMLGDQNRQEFINEQLDTLELQIQDTTTEIARLQEELGNMTSARQITDAQNQITALQAKLTTLQANYANLLANSQSGAINTLTVIEPAAVPIRPVGPAKVVLVLMAAMLGFVISAGAAYLLDYLDDTLKSPEDIARTIQYPVIGYILETPEDEDQVYVTENPRSPVTEAFRSLRTNLEFAAVDAPLQSVLITSAEKGAGKTSLAGNLAAVIAQGDRRVILVDADLRKPSIHKLFRISNDFGLSDIFRGRVNPEDVLVKWKDTNLAILPSGPTPPNPTELLASKRMDQILSQLKGLADIVIVDAPPFILADTAVLSAKVDGVLLVVSPGQTREAAARAMMEQIRRAGARVLGVALNRIPERNADMYGGYLSYGSYYGDDSNKGDGDTKPNTSSGPRVIRGKTAHAKDNP